ncbi:MAG: EscD/YscD/HrpQ family type III secretion system inner membrane ring protein, partial [Duodenibacillus sp.]|nr:EscD/YscD/HrpQ family type III secretion system inner membrane ring protein [Duodenibacillus sp.]
VTGVSGGALQFVSLSGGQKVFLGGTMPGGFVLDDIQEDRLVLRKMGRTIYYPLRFR